MHSVLTHTRTCMLAYAREHTHHMVRAICQSKAESGMWTSHYYWKYEGILQGRTCWDECLGNASASSARLWDSQTCKFPKRWLVHVEPFHRACFLHVFTWTHAAFKSLLRYRRQPPSCDSPTASVLGVAVKATREDDDSPAVRWRQNSSRGGGDNAPSQWVVPKSMQKYLEFK